MSSRRPGLAALPLLVVALSVAGCGAVSDWLHIGLRPGVPVATPVVTRGPTETVPAPPVETRPPTSIAPDPTPALGGEARVDGLLYVEGERIMGGDALGGDAVELVSLRNLLASDLAGTQLALLQGELLHVVDVERGTLRSVHVPAGGPITAAQLVWGGAGRGILHVVVVADARARTFGQHVELRPVNARDGSVGAPLIISDVADVTVLHYDDEARRALVIPRDDTPDFGQVDLYELDGGSLVASFPARGEGLAVASPDGRRLLAARRGARGGGLLVYHLTEGGWRAPQAWEAPPGTAPNSFAWSPDGGRIACFVQPQEGAEPDAAEAGVWVLRAETMAATHVAGSGGALVDVIAWLPSGERLVLHRYASARGEDSAPVVGYYALDLDGGHEEALPMAPEATLLGWMPRSPGAELRRAAWATGGAWIAAYYPNTTLSGEPDVVREERSLSLDRTTLPVTEGLTDAGFSVRWMRTIALETSGVYAFTVRGDGGVRVWVDGMLALDGRAPFPVASLTVELDLEAGEHDIQVEYVNDGAPAVLALSWAALDQAIVVDDMDPGFALGGDPTGIYERDDGHGGHLYWTWNSRGEIVNWARWYPDLARAGTYEVQVYIPERYHNTLRATYAVHHDGATDEVAVDQSACRDQWISLGTYYFAGSADEYVTLGDATGEDYATRLVGFDAARFVPVGGVATD